MKGFISVVRGQHHSLANLSKG